MKKIIAILAAGGIIGSPAAANAALVIDITQSGKDIVVAGHGSIDTSLLEFAGFSTHSPVLNPEYGGVIVGRLSSTKLYYRTISNPRSFGAASYSFYPVQVTGDTFGFYGDRGTLILPSSYVSGATLAGTATYASATFASLRLTQGSYVYNVINGDTITVNVGAVPEPATWALITLGMGAVGFAMRRRRKVETMVRYA